MDSRICSMDCLTWHVSDCKLGLQNKGAPQGQSSVSQKANPSKGTIKIHTHLKSEKHNTRESLCADSRQFFRPNATFILHFWINPPMTFRPAEAERSDGSFCLFLERTHPLAGEYVLFSLAGLKGNLSLLEILLLFFQGA